MKVLELNVKGIECAGCEARIKNAISELKEVQEVTASHETGKVNIVFKKELTEEIENTIIALLKRMDFEVEK